MDNKKVHTLIVEDDPMVSDINKNYLKRVESFHLMGTVNNGQEALNQIKFKKIDLLLLDIYMPSLNGLELLRKIRTENHKMDVIIITAADSPQVIEEAMRLGVVDCILKPFDFQRFKNALLMYKKRYILFQSTRAISQDGFDSLQFHSKQNEDHLPKGIDPVTLNLVRDALMKTETPLSVQGISSKIDISTLTIRKYLEYLAKNNEIQLDLQYSGNGRPTKLYSYNLL